MRRVTLWATLFFALATFQPTTAAAGRTLEASIERKDAVSVGLDTAVGDVMISPSADGAIHVTVRLTPRKGGIFSSLEKAKEQVEAATLSVRRHGKRIDLEIQGFSGEPRFEARWQLAVTPDLALEIDMGVGDLKIEGIAGPIEADLGVGDVDLEGTGGEVAIDVGVGDITVKAPAAAYGSIECSTGVGDASVRAGENSSKGTGMISKDLSWTGKGSGSMDLETGVGSIAVVLTGPTGDRPAGDDEDS